MDDDRKKITMDDLAQMVAARANLPLELAQVYTFAFFEIIKASLCANGQVLLSKLGKFEIRRKNGVAMPVFILAQEMYWAMNLKD